MSFASFVSGVRHLVPLACFALAACGGRGYVTYFYDSSPGQDGAVTPGPDANGPRPDAETPGPDATTGRDSDVRPDVVVTPDAPACVDGLQLCNGTCVNLLGDRNNCGTCGTRCTSTQTCLSGRCGCASGTNCGGTCANLQTDTANCGTCGVRCATGQSCSSGVCRCPANQTVCSGACTDLRTDSANCGTCGTRCATGQTCTANTCTTSTPVSYSMTSGTLGTFTDACVQASAVPLSFSQTDDATVALPITFSVRYFGATYSTGWVSTNGVAGFGTANNAYSNVCPDADGVIPNAAFPFWGDLDLGTTGSVCGAVITTTAGRRRLVVTWKGVKDHAFASAYTFSALIEETTGIIEFQYQTMTVPDGDAGAPPIHTIGLAGTDATQFSTAVCPTSSQPNLNNRYYRFTPTG